MKVGACDSSSRAHQSNLLAARDGVAGRDERLAQVEISCDDARSVIDVHDVAGEKESVHQCDNAAVCSRDWRADRALEIDAEVTASYATVEYSPGTEAASDA